MKLITVMVPVVIGFKSGAFASEGQRANSVLLNGEWEFARGEGDERAETPAGQGAQLAEGYLTGPIHGMEPGGSNPNEP